MGAFWLNSQDKAKRTHLSAGIFKKLQRFFLDSSKNL